MSAAGGSHLDLVFHRPVSMTVFRPQVQGNRLVASKLNCHLFNCCVVYALMYDTMYFLIDVRLYSAILRSLEQTHCARMWFYMSD